MEHPAENSLPGHNAIPYLMKDRTVRMAFLPDLRDFAQGRAHAQLCPHRQTEKADAEFLSTKNEFILSGQQNTLVFVLDAFDSEYMCELLEEYPEEIRESFHDFVFYHNTSGGATP